MELLTIDSWEELKNRKIDLNEDSFIAVEGLIFDREARWILHRRGPKCRDEHYKLEGIGGRINKGESFYHALSREIAEEVGKEAEIKIFGVLEIRKDTVFDSRLNQDVTWVIVSYLCRYETGELLRMEPEKNLGYERFDIENVVVEELSSSSKAAYETLRKAWKEIQEMLKVNR